MAPENAEALKQRLRDVGLSRPAIEAAWPRWWSDEAEISLSARVELRFSLARNLGLDPRTLFDEADRPTFVWRNEARFKHGSSETDIERDAITSFGRALGSLLVAASPERVSSPTGSASGFRRLILNAGRPFVRLLDLLSLCWAIGVPVVHLRVFPWPQKRMAAMSVRVHDRFVILLGKDSMFPAQIAFYLAHELGHVLLQHLASSPILVDIEQATPSIEGQDEDDDEAAADRFALELITGDPRPTVLPAGSGYSARELARVAHRSAPRLRIEPGILAMCFGYSTRDWATANAALPLIYADPKPVWSEVNRLALSQLQLDQLPSDARDYLASVLDVPAG